MPRTARPADEPAEKKRKKKPPAAAARATPPPRRREAGSAGTSSSSSSRRRHHRKASAGGSGHHHPRSHRPSAGRHDTRSHRSHHPSPGRHGTRSPSGRRHRRGAAAEEEGKEQARGVRRCARRAAGRLARTAGHSEATLAKLAAAVDELRGAVGDAKHAEANSDDDFYIRVLGKDDAGLLRADRLEAELARQIQRLTRCDYSAMDKRLEKLLAPTYWQKIKAEYEVVVPVLAAVGDGVCALLTKQRDVEEEKQDVKAVVGRSDYQLRVLELIPEAVVAHLAVMTKQSGEKDMQLFWASLRSFRERVLDPMQALLEVQRAELQQKVGILSAMQLTGNAAPSSEDAAARLRALSNRALVVERLRLLADQLLLSARLLPLLKQQAQQQQEQQQPPQPSQPQQAKTAGRSRERLGS